MTQHSIKVKYTSVALLSIVLMSVQVSYCMSFKSMKIPALSIRMMDLWGDYDEVHKKLLLEASITCLKLKNNAPQEGEDVDMWCREWVSKIYGQLDTEYFLFMRYDDARKKEEEESIELVKKQILARKESKESTPISAKSDKKEVVVEREEDESEEDDSPHGSVVKSFGESEYEIKYRQLRNLMYKQQQAMKEPDKGYRIEIKYST